MRTQDAHHCGSAAQSAASKVNRALLLGVPNFDSIHGLQQMLRGHDVGLVRIIPELMATMPTLFQLLHWVPLPPGGAPLTPPRTGPGPSRHA